MITPLDHRTSAKPERWTQPGLPMVRSEDSTTSCSCGWSKTHSRAKVREDAAEAHLAKRHRGRGIWL